jgi:hypothetical protein
MKNSRSHLIIEFTMASNNAVLVDLGNGNVGWYYVFSAVPAGVCLP